MPRADRSKQYHKTCGACGAEFVTHKPKAIRCQSCIDSNTPAKRQAPRGEGKREKQPTIPSPPESGAQRSVQPPKGVAAGAPKEKDDKALSESLRASVEATAPLYILGPDVFEEVSEEALRTFVHRDNAREAGMHMLPDLPYLFLDEKARALYVYKNIVGLVWPCHKPDLERRSLEQKFEDGWASGDLAFLAAVPESETDFYRETLCEPCVEACTG